MLARLLSATSLLVVLTWVVSVYSLNTGESALRRGIREYANRMAADSLHEIRLAMSRRIETWRVAARSPSLRAMLRADNKQWAALPDRAAIIAARDQEWRSGGDNPFAERIEASTVSRELRSDLAARRAIAGFPVFGEVFVTNRYGVNAAQTSRTSDFRQDDERWWVEARDRGQYYGSVEYDDSARIHSIDIALRIEDTGGEFLGVLKAVYNIRDVLELLDEWSRSYRRSAESFITLVDQRDVVVHSTSSQWKFGTSARELLDGLLKNTGVSHVTRNHGEQALLVVRAGSVVDPWTPHWSLVVESDLGVLLSPVRSLRRKVLWLAGIVTFVGVLIAWTVLRSIPRRMAQLRIATREIGAGNLNYEVEPLGRDEIGELANSFNHMTERLRAGQLAELSNRAKSAFLANMSHEIRTPLTAIVGYGDLLVETSVDEEARREYLRAISGSAHHLLRVINDILDLSKIEAGRVDLEVRPCSPAAVIGDVVRLLQPRAQDRGLQLIAEFETKIPRAICADTTRLGQIFLNLVGNALKFTEKGVVRIVSHYRATTLHAGIWSIDVRDTGIGMSPAQVEKIFKPFVQADSSTTRRFGGTGLGLTIAHELARLMNGELSATSVEGEGTTFTLTLPVIEEEPIEMVEPDVATHLPPRKKTTPQQSIEGTRILLAEDTKVNQRLMVAILERAGAVVSVVANGALAVEAGTQAMRDGGPYDLILMDLMMPVLDGEAATIQLRATGYPGPIVALTADALEDTRDRCLAHGFDGFITKPIQRAKLLEAVVRWSASMQCAEAPASPRA